MNEPVLQMSSPPDPGNQHQALQVLTLAQRTADEHIHSARDHADKIRADAQAKADQIIREAQARAGGLQQDAEKALSDAHAAAAEIAREAQGHANNARRNAEEILSDARTRADEVAQKAQQNADELMRQAQMRYEDMVGSLVAKREALQRQIEALEQFDREYRSRLTTFMQSQLRALWVEEPRVDSDGIEALDAEPVAIPVPAQAGPPARS